MRKTAIILFILFFLLTLSYEIIQFLISERIRKELVKVNVMVKHVSVSLLQGKVKIKNMEGKDKWINWKVKNLRVRFNPVGFLRERSIEEMTVKGLDLRVHFPPPPSDPILPYIKKLRIEEGNFSLLLRRGELKGKIRGEVSNLGEGKKAEFRLKGWISSSPFEVEGKFSLPRPDDFMEWKGNIKFFPYEVLVREFKISLPPGFSFLEDSGVLFQGRVKEGVSQMSFFWEGVFLGKKKRFSLLWEGEWGREGKFSFSWEER